MGFSERRKILKEKNFLELKPVPLCEISVNEKSFITLLIPKFQNKFVVKFINPLLKSPNIKVNLDELGSAVWKLMDGKNTVEDISKTLQNQFSKNENSIEERLLKFLTELYIQKLITFEEIKGV